MYTNIYELNNREPPALQNDIHNTTMIEILLHIFFN